MCDLVQDLKRGNFSMSSGKKISNEEQGYDTCGLYGLGLPPEKSTIGKVFEWLGGLLKTTKSNNSTYDTYEGRLKSFETWPKHKIQLPEKLAEAGFYYKKSEDATICFDCGLGMSIWKGDDDPWVEHAKWSAKCKFVISQKGKELTQDEGFKKEAVVSEAIILPEEKIEKLKGRDECGLFIPSFNSSLNSNSNFAINETDICVNCHLREKGVMFLPCGHFVSCTQCAPSTSTCLFCKQPHKATVRVYLS